MKVHLYLKSLGTIFRRIWDIPLEDIDELKKTKVIIFYNKGSICDGLSIICVRHIHHKWSCLINFLNETFVTNCLLLIYHLGWRRPSRSFQLRCLFCDDMLQFKLWWDLRRACDEKSVVNIRIATEQTYCDGSVRHSSLIF